MVFSSMMKFCLGRLAITPAVLQTIPPDEICRAIDRHVCGDWGDVSPQAHTENEAALLSGLPLVSVYRDSDGTEFWLLTTGDRLNTTVHLPGELIV